MELALGQKGPVAPPPVLKNPLQSAVQEISSWKDVVAATHWHLYNKGQVDGIDFYVHERELGHIHLNGDVHLATDERLMSCLLAKKLASPFPFAGYEHWVLFRIDNRNHADHASWLFRLNYDRLQGVCSAQLIERIDQYPDGD